MEDAKPSVRFTKKTKQMNNNKKENFMNSIFYHTYKKMKT